jgi:regulator of protease activity HflC (stomatin/prohibitin superfamily)
MAQVKTFGPFRQLRSDASAHVQRFRAGRLVQQGRGLSFWFLPHDASIAEAPLDDRDLPFLFRGRSRDFQTVTVQGLIVWRVADPATLATRIDFSLNLETGAHLGQPMDQIATLLTGLAQQLSAQQLAAYDINAILAAGVAPLLARMEAGLIGAKRLAEMGLEVVNVRIADLSPNSELGRALQTPTFERVQQQADQATFERRALAVEKERAIAENELGNQIELARRQAELIEREAENSRQRAVAEADAQRIAAEAEAGTIRLVEQARTDMERNRVDIYGALPTGVLMALAARELAGKLTTVEHLNVTPDLLASFVGEAFGRGRQAA